MIPSEDTAITAPDFIDFRAQIDLDSIYLALGLERLSSHDDEDRFHCPDFDGLHKHGDRTGKFFFNRSKVVGHCFVCGPATLPMLVERVLGLDKQAAMQWLYQFTKEDANDERAYLAALEKIFETPENEYDVLPYYNVDVMQRWNHPHAFFAERGISDRVRAEYGCGYWPENNSIVFPHFWQKGLVGWQERRFSGGPRYKATSDFPRKNTLWGFDRAHGTPLVVESVPTALRAISDGYTALATFGAAVNPEQTRLLRKFQAGVILAPDNDAPGQKWLHSLVEALTDYIPLYVVDCLSEPGADIGDLPEDTLKPWVEETKREIVVT